MSRLSRPVSSTRSLSLRGRSNVPNQFAVRVLRGPVPPNAGSFLVQTTQAAVMAALTSSAKLSVSSQGRKPSNGVVRELLGSLKPTPLLSREESALIEYRSVVPRKTPHQLYQAFVNKPADLFGQAGLKVRPDAGELQDGAKLMLEDSSMLGGVWFPVQVRLNPAIKGLTFQTLDGHPLRGANAFRFEPNGASGTQVLQTSAFQSSSKLSALGSKISNVLEHQHSVWEHLHAALYR